MAHNRSALVVTVFCLGLGARSAVAQPTVTSVSGEAAHGDRLDVGGSSFGLKDPAAPRVWDDCTSSPPLDTHYDAWLPTGAQQGPEYDMAYRAVPFRSIDGPHPRLGYILGGAHATDSSAGSPIAVSSTSSSSTRATRAARLASR